MWLELRIFRAPSNISHTGRTRTSLNRKSSLLNTEVCSRIPNSCALNQGFLVRHQRFVVCLIHFSRNRSHQLNWSWIEEEDLGSLSRLNLGERGHWLLCFKVYFCVKLLSLIGWRESHALAPSRAWIWSPSQSLVVHQKWTRWG